MLQDWQWKMLPSRANSPKGPTLLICAAGLDFVRLLC